MAKDAKKQGFFGRFRRPAPEPRPVTPKPRAPGSDPRQAAPEPRQAAPEPRLSAPMPRAAAPMPRAPASPATPQPPAPAPERRSTPIPTNGLKDMSMAEEKVSAPKLRYEDRADLFETFADSVGPCSFDGQSMRLEFTVTRFDPAKP